MAWLQISFETDAAHADKLADFLQRFGASSVSLMAVSDEPLFGQPFEETNDLWQQTRVISLFPEDVDLDILLVCARDHIGAENIKKRTIEILPEQDWIKSYQQSHPPLTFGDRLAITPSWCEPPAAAKHNITLDPGLAFGTGGHATTGLCLEWLVRQDITGKSVIDYGCGSGILALAAACLGAARVYAVDIDPQAIRASSDNARANELAEQVIIATPDEIALPEVDILLANVLLNPLLDLAERFSTLVRPGGHLVLSGILAAQVDDCLVTYDSWFNMQEPVFKDEWALLQGIRK